MNMMLNIGDYVLHTTSGKFGQVVAYGHEIVNCAYLPTLRVEVVDETGMSKRTFEEDVTNNWIPVKKEEISQCYVASNVASQSSKVLTRI
jgi:hypothetical protein